LQTGEQVIQYDAGVGIVCMRLYKQLLFAGCYDGNIYVFDINVSVNLLSQIIIINLLQYITYAQLNLFTESQINMQYTWSRKYVIKHRGCK